MKIFYGLNTFTGIIIVFELIMDISIIYNNNEETFLQYFLEILKLSLPNPATLLMTNIELGGQIKTETYIFLNLTTVCSLRKRVKLSLA